jgi:predicted HTH domain antitoxin
MSVVIPDEVLYTAHISADELRQEVAILLYEKERLTLGQASQLANMSQLQFRHLLASRNVYVNYDVEDFEADLRTLKDLGRL